MPITSPVDFISGPSTVSTAGEAGERKHRLLDPDVIERRRCCRDRSSRAIRPAMMRAAILATGRPMTLATNGTVREARGLTSST